MTRLLYTGNHHQTVFEFTNFKYSSYEYDYSKGEKGRILNRKNIFWNGQQRHVTVMTYFDAFKSKLNGQDFDTLLGLPQIFMNIVSDDQMNKNESASTKKTQTKETNKFLVEELQRLGKEALTHYISERLRSMTNEQSTRIEKQTVFQFLIKQIDLTMTTLNLEPFLHANLKNLRVKISLESGNSTTTKVSMQRIRINKCNDLSNFDLSRTSVLRRLDNSEDNSQNDRDFGSDDELGNDAMTVLRVMFDEKKKDTKGKPSDIINNLEEIEVKGFKNPQSPSRRRPVNIEQSKSWSKGAFNLEQTVYTIEALGINEAKRSGLNPKWSVVKTLEISTKPLEVIVDYEILKFFREYLLVREWNSILKIIQKNAQDVETVVSLLT